MSRSPSDDKPKIESRSIVDFLANIWSEGGVKDCYAFVGWKRDGVWHQRPIHLSQSEEFVADLLRQHSGDDLYFCPNVFSEPHRKRSCALPTRWAWCDIDEGDPSKFVAPTFGWETSPGRYQALWWWDKAHKPEDAEQFSRSIAKACSADGTGWEVTKMLRIPGSLNFKRSRPHLVRIVREDCTPIKLRPKVDAPSEPSSSSSVTGSKLSHALKRASVKMYMMPAREGFRSDWIYGLVLRLQELGVSDDECVQALLMCPSFVDKYGHDEAAARNEVKRILSKRRSG